MEKEKIKLLDDHTLLNKHLKIFNQGRWDDQDDLEEELLFRLNWKERLIEQIEASKIKRENKTIGDQVHNICLMGVIAIIKNFK